MRSTRQALCAAVLLVLLPSVGCHPWHRDPCTGRPPDQTRVDIHAHVFSTDHIPVAGYLEHAAGVPRWLARLLASIVQRRTPDAAAREVEHELGDEEVESVLRSYLAAETARRSTPDEDRELWIALRGLLDGEQQLEQEERVVFEQLMQELEAGPAAESAKRRGVGRLALVICNVRWAHLMTHSSSWQAGDLLATYPEVGLFTPMMMDMWPWLLDPGCQEEPEDESACASSSALRAQYEAMRGVIQEYPGRVLPFVAFDPRRQARHGSSLRLVERALEEGFGGVKLYPPMGYRPWNNAELPSTPEDPRPPDAVLWDAALRQLYDLCVARDVPIAAHCSDPGAEARKGRGKNADPALWRPVLDHYRARGSHLRLNLCHAGGIDDLIKHGEDSWTWTIGRLIQEGNEGVFADLGHLDELLEASEAARIRAALDVFLARFPEAKRRLLFGTDWHMIVRYPEHTKYLRAHEAFVRENYPLQLDDWLGRNALRYLGLSTTPGTEHPPETAGRLRAFFERNDHPIPAWMPEVDLSSH